LVLAALVFAGFSSLHGENPGKAEGLKLRPTQAELEKRAAERTDPLAAHRELEAVAPKSIHKKERSMELGGLLERSTILAYGGHWTLVPKGSVLHVPPAFRSRISSTPAGTLLSWQDFHERNRGWIFTQAVAMENARGEAALSETILESHQQVGRIVVAVLHNGPISVRAPLPQKAQ
jgi:hypothetical protein